MGLHSNSQFATLLRDFQFFNLILRMLWLFIFGLSTSTWALKNESSFQCHDNQWLCGTQCIHQRSFCTLSGTCHPDFPRPCGDGERCYHRLENCWNAACLNSNCQRDANLDGVDKNQVKTKKNLGMFRSFHTSSRLPTGPTGSPKCLLKVCILGF